MSARLSTKIAGATPLVILGLFYLYAAVVRGSMGTFPNPDTLLRPLRVLEIVVGAPLLLLYPFAALAIVVLSLSCWGRFRVLRGGALAFLAAATFVIAVC